MNLTDKFINPRKYVLRKWFLSILGDRYAKHDEIVERVAVALATQKDTEDFGKLVSDVYEVAYLKCLDDCKAKLAAMNIHVNIV